MFQEYLRKEIAILRVRAKEVEKCRSAYMIAGLIYR